MYPTAIIGGLLLVAVSRAMARPGRRRLALSAVLAGLVLLSGALGFIMGLMRTLQIASEASFPDTIVCMGISESLNNIALALVLLAIAATMSSIALWRRGGGRSQQVGNLPAE